MNRVITILQHNTGITVIAFLVPLGGFDYFRKCRPEMNYGDHFHHVIAQTGRVGAVPTDQWG